MRSSSASRSLMRSARLLAITLLSRPPSDGKTITKTRTGGAGPLLRSLHRSEPGSRSPDLIDPDSHEGQSIYDGDYRQNLSPFLDALFQVDGHVNSSSLILSHVEEVGRKLL